MLGSLTSQDEEMEDAAKEGEEKEDEDEKEEEKDADEKDAAEKEAAAEEESGKEVRPNRFVKWKLAQGESTCLLFQEEVSGDLLCSASADFPPDALWNTGNIK